MSKAGKILEAFIRPPDPYNTSYRDGYVGKVDVTLKGVAGLPNGMKDIGDFLSSKIRPALDKLVDLDSTGTGNGYESWLLCSYTNKSADLIAAVKKVFKDALSTEVKVVAVK